MSVAFLFAYLSFSLHLFLSSQLSILGTAVDPGHPSDRRCAVHVCAGDTAENQLQ